MTSFDDLRAQDVAAAALFSERGRLLAPDLDDRRWQDIVDEASSLIDRYAPQWTDRNPSDIGMTLVELFAWLVESLIYRLNRVPEKNYVAFLNLLGITRAPQTPARTLLTFTAAGAVEIPAGTAAQTQGTETEAPVVFETDTPLTVTAAPVITAVRVDHAGDPDAPAYADITDLLVRRPGAAELRQALIEVSRAASEGTQICLGLKAAGPPPAVVDVYVEPVRPLLDRRAGERVEWFYSTAGGPPLRWDPLQVVSDGSGGLVRPGVVRVRVPDGGPAWVAQDPKEVWGLPEPAGALHWLGVRITNDPELRPPDAELGGGSAERARVTLRLDRLLPDTTTAASVGTVTGERLGLGTGRARQVLRLARRPVHARPGTDTPYDHVQVTVAGVPWHAVGYLSPDTPTAFLLDPVTGEITFGDHDPATGSGGGSVPADGELILATYRFVSAGAAANVPADALQVLSSGGGGLTGVTNPVRAIGGADEEPIEETKRRAPEVLRHRDRAVTADDFEVLARGAAPGIAIVRCLPPRLHTDQLAGPGGWLRDDPWTYGNLQRPPGVVNVIVVPDLGPDDPEPTPSLALVQDVIRVLDRRRPVATALHVAGPRYVRVAVQARVSVFPTALAGGLVTNAAEKARVERLIRAFLHPVYGGRRGTGWEIGESAYVTDLYQAIRPADDVGYITELRLGAEMLVYAPPPGDDERQRPIPDAIGTLANQVRIADYELVCAGTVTVEIDVSQ